MEEVREKLKKTYKSVIEELLVENWKVVKKTKKTLSVDVKCRVIKAMIPFVESCPKTQFLSITNKSLFTADDPILRYVPSIHTEFLSSITWFEGTSYGSKSFEMNDMNNLIFIKYYQKLNMQKQAYSFLGLQNEQDTKENTKYDLSDLFCSICLVFDCGFHTLSNPQIIKFDEPRGCICEDKKTKNIKLEIGIDDMQISQALQLKPCIQRKILNTSIPCKQYPNPRITKKVITKSREGYNSFTFFEICDSNTRVCPCVQRETNCEYFCGCITCSNTMSCSCEECDEKCPCLLESRECTALCKNHSKDTCLCRNMPITNQTKRNLSICKSTKHGLGLFSEEFIPAYKFVIEYTGELISDKEAERRGNFYEMNKASYLFNCMFSGENCLFSLDAFFLGNKSRYINHSVKNANIASKILFSHGMARVVFYSLRDIYKGEELLFDYQFTEEHKLKHGIVD